MVGEGKKPFFPSNTSSNKLDNAIEKIRTSENVLSPSHQVKNTNINHHHRDKTKEGEIDNRNIEEVQETINEGQLLYSGKLRTLDSNTSKGSNSGSSSSNRCNKNDDDMLRSSQNSGRKSIDTINNENMIEVAITEVQVMSSSQAIPQSFIDTSKFEGHIDGEISGDGTREEIINNIPKIARESGLSPKQNTIEKKSRHWVSWDNLCLPKAEMELVSGLLLMCLMLFFASCGGI
ncbi:hypothetical protein H5410_005647 [Solanum commersonii]|uniref:Uncharacterized protein n=1 Tax=Solanum commersonii TaxID=4109 RepID=A0A9J6A765_SOLCO|nr:hypothetical protein H5410_005647 [Solanum commersonii]